MSEPSALEALANRIDAILPASVKIKTDTSGEWQDRFIIALTAEDQDLIVAALRAAPAQEPMAWPDRESIAKVFALIWHGDVGEWEGFLSKADAFLACPWLDIPRAAPPADAKAAELVKALEDVLRANSEFRAGMPDDWDGDPLQDACDSALNVLAAWRGK